MEDLLPIFFLCSFNYADGKKKKKKENRGSQKVTCLLCLAREPKRRASRPPQSPLLHHNRSGSASRDFVPYFRGHKRLISHGTDSSCLPTSLDVVLVVAEEGGRLSERRNVESELEKKEEGRRRREAEDDPSHSEKRTGSRVLLLYLYNPWWIPLANWQPVVRDSYVRKRKRSKKIRRKAKWKCCWCLHRASSIEGSEQ